MVEPTLEQHKERHEFLHKCLGELLADFISHTEHRPSETTILTLLEWSHQQTISPTIQRF